MKPVLAITSVTFFLVATVHALTLSCDQIVVDKKKFDLTKITGPHSVTTSNRDEPPAIRNTTWTLDLCQPLKVKEGDGVGKFCGSGTRVCGVESMWNPVVDPDRKNIMVDKVIPVAGFVGDFQEFDPKVNLLKDDDGKELGLVIDMHGPKYSGKYQKASIELRCDSKRTGNEGQGEDDKIKSRDDKEDEAKDESSLTFISYTDDAKRKDTMTLKLLWKTKYVCPRSEGDADDDNSDGTTKKASWGFFTWFILIAFLGIAAYLIFGSWLNYNRYGARGWDLLPHGDTIRDVPYIFKDFSRKVLDTFSGSGSRGGYSAV